MNYKLLNEEIKKAMKEKNKNRLLPLRMIKSDVVVEAKKNGSSEESVFLQSLIKRVKALEKSKNDMIADANKKGVDISVFLNYIEYDICVTKEFLPRLIESEEEYIKIANILIEEFKDFKSIAGFLKANQILNINNEPVTVNTSKLIPLIRDILK